MKIVLEGGPRDGEKAEVDGDPASPPPTWIFAGTEFLIAKRLVYKASSIIRPWTDQTWSWVYTYDGEFT